MESTQTQSTRHSHRITSPLAWLVGLLAALVLLVAAPASAADLDMREHIEVTGTAEVKVVPDEFVIRTTIETFDQKLSKASRANEEAVRKAFVNVKELGVERRYIVTDDVRVNAVTQGYRPRGDFRRLGFNVSRNITVVLHNSAQIQPVIKELFAVGVDQLNMTLGHTELAKHLQAAQIAAAKQARQKAGIMTAALGRGLGKAVSIAEQSPQRNQASNFVYSAATPDLGDSLSLGKLKVVASVKVKFLLTD